MAFALSDHKLALKIHWSVPRHGPTQATEIGTILFECLNFWLYSAFVNTCACVSLICAVTMQIIAPAGSCLIINCVLLLPTLILSYINTYTRTQLSINKTYLFTLRAKYSNYNSVIASKSIYWVSRNLKAVPDRLYQINSGEFTISLCMLSLYQGLHRNV